MTIYYNADLLDFVERTEESLRGRVSWLIVNSDNTMQFGFIPERVAENLLDAWFDKWIQAEIQDIFSLNEVKSATFMPCECQIQYNAGADLQTALCYIDEVLLNADIGSSMYWAGINDVGISLKFSETCFDMAHVASVFEAVLKLDNTGDMYIKLESLLDDFYKTFHSEDYPLHPVFENVGTVELSMALYKLLASCYETDICVFKQQVKIELARLTKQYIA